jgi:hypothetical protein
MAQYQRLPVSALKVDENVYPRSQLDRVTVWRYANAIEAGARLDEARDPIRAWRRNGDYVLLDGAHRCAAYEQVFGPEHMVRVLVHERDEFADDVEATLAAVSYNSVHGKNVTQYDLALVYARLRQHGVTVERLAEAAMMPVATLQRNLERRLALGPLQPAADTTEQSLVALKRPAIHLAGDVLSLDQADYQRKAVGLAQLRMIRELIRLIDTHTLDLENAEVRSALRALYRRLAVLLGDGAPARRKKAS